MSQAAAAAIANHHKTTTAQVMNEATETVGDRQRAKQIRDNEKLAKVRRMRLFTVAGLIVAGIAIFAAVAYFERSRSSYTPTDAELSDPSVAIAPPAVIVPDTKADSVDVPELTPAEVQAIQIAALTDRVGKLERAIVALSVAPQVTGEVITESVVAADPPQQTKRMEVRQQYSNLRAEPNAAARIIQTFEIGVTVTVDRYANEWYRVVIGQGQFGWMHKSTLKQLDG